jgi:DNA-binding CsgD family transcriptional regulator
MVLFSLDLIQKEGLIKVFKKQLSNLAKKQPNNPDIRSLKNQFDISNVITKDWSFFNDAFNKTFPGFTEKVVMKYPNLSQKDLQHCILIKLNTPPAQAANILGINTESTHTARYRLRKKMNLIRQDNLEHIILNF